MDLSIIALVKEHQAQKRRAKCGPPWSSDLGSDCPLSRLPVLSLTPHPNGVLPDWSHMASLTLSGQG